MAIGSLRERYKQATDELSDLLVNVANTCTDITHLVQALRSPQACQQVAKGKVDLELRPSEYLPMAEAIRMAAEDPLCYFTFSWHIIRIARKVIRLRREVHEGYAVRSIAAQGSLTESDHSHKYFIEAVEGVERALMKAFYTLQAREQADFTRAILQPDPLPYVTPGCDKAASSDAPLDAIEDDENYSPSATSVEWAKCSQSSGRTTNRIDLSKATVKASKEVVDRTFAAWCHLKDMHDIRVEIRSTWEAYDQGSISEFQANQATQAAMALLQCTDDTFGVLYPDLDNYDKLLKFLGFEIVEFPGQAVVYIANREEAPSGSTRSPAPANLVELISPIGAQINAKFQECLSRLDRNRPDHKKRKTKSPVEPPSAREKEWRNSHKLVSLLLDNANGILHYAEDPGVKSDDLFLKGLVLQSSQTWVNVACEMYAELLDVAGKDPGFGVQVIEKCIEQDLKLRRIKKKFEAEGPNEAAPQGIKPASVVMNRESARETKRLHMISPEFNAGDFNSLDYKRQEEEINKSGAKYATGLERFFPVLAGCTRYQLELDMLVKASKIANFRFTFHAAYLLYNAARRIGIVHQDWMDLDTISSSHSPDGPWLLKMATPRKLDQFAAVYTVTTGLRFLTIRNQERTGAKQVRVFHDPDKIHRFHGAKLMHKLLDAEETMKVSSSKQLQRVLHGLATERSQLERETATSDGLDYSPSELLQEYNKSFSEGEDLMSMDLAGFLNDIDELILKIRDHVKPDSDYSAKEFALSLLRDLGGYVGREGLASQSLLAKGAKILNAYIAEHGDKYTKEAHEKGCKNRDRASRERLYEVSDSERSQREEFDEQLKRAGTMVSRSDKIMALYNPRLTRRDLEECNMEHSSLGCVKVPRCMLEGPIPEALKEEDVIKSKDRSGSSASGEENQDVEDHVDEKYAAAGEAEVYEKNLQDLTGKKCEDDTNGAGGANAEKSQELEYVQEGHENIIESGDGDDEQGNGLTDTGKAKKKRKSGKKKKGGK